MSTNPEVPELVQRYFDLASQPDRDAYFAQFAPGATVEDEGKEHHGLDAIRAWRSETPLVSYSVGPIEQNDQIYDAVVEIAGDFPGSPVKLNFHFELDDMSRVLMLTIRP